MLLGVPAAVARKPPPANTITIPAISLPVGSVSEGGVRMGSEVDVVTSAGGAQAGTHHLGVRLQLRVRAESLAVDGALPSREKETYLEATSKIVVDGKERLVDLPFAGKTIIRERKGGKVRSTDSDGVELTGALAAYDRHEQATFGLPNPLDDLVRGRPLTVGDTFTLTPEAGAALVGARDQPQAHLEAGTIRLGEVRDGLAVFEVRFVESRPPMSDVILVDNWRGTMMYAIASGQLVEAHLRATVTGRPTPERAAQGFTVAAKGLADIDFTAAITLPDGVGVDGGHRGK
jgi:hypothetical protein